MFESKVYYFLTQIITQIIVSNMLHGSMLVVLELKTQLMNYLKTNDNMCRRMGRRMWLKQNGVTTIKTNRYYLDIIVMIVFII